MQAVTADSLRAAPRPLPIPLAWALAASIALHVGIGVAMLTAGGPPGTIARYSPSLEATLVIPESEPETMVLAAAVPTSMPAMPATHVPEPSPPVAAVRSPIGTVRAKPGLGTLADLKIEGAVLQDHARLGGEIQTRQLNEFPAEVDVPVRIHDKVVVDYPPAALASGRDESVAVWAIVAVDGTVDEVILIDGAAGEFADAVVTAVKAARFVPARNNLASIRFPIALEFRPPFAEPTADEKAALAARPPR